MATQNRLVLCRPLSYSRIRRGETASSSASSWRQVPSPGGVAPTLLCTAALRLGGTNAASPWALCLPGCNCQPFPLDCSSHVMPGHSQSLVFDCVQCCHLVNSSGGQIEHMFLPLFLKCSM